MLLPLTSAVFLLILVDRVAFDDIDDSLVTGSETAPYKSIAHGNTNMYVCRLLVTEKHSWSKLPSGTVLRRCSDVSYIYHRSFSGVLSGQGPRTGRSARSRQHARNDKRKTSKRKTKRKNAWRWGGHHWRQRTPAHERARSGGARCGGCARHRLWLDMDDKNMQLKRSARRTRR